jgi:hypothetical protein
MTSSRRRWRRRPRTISLRMRIASTGPHPDSGPLPEPADLATPELEEVLDRREGWPRWGQPGSGHETGRAAGAGFADGGELDVLGPGVPLAGFADDAHTRLAALTDDELIGVLHTWRRQTCLSTVRPGCYRPGSARGRLRHASRKGRSADRHFCQCVCRRELLCDDSHKLRQLPGRPGPSGPSQGDSPACPECRPRAARRAQG